MNRNNICLITIFANRINIHERKWLQIGIGIHLWPKYQRIDSWQIYLRTICEIIANRALFAEHWKLYPWSWSSEVVTRILFLSCLIESFFTQLSGSIFIFVKNTHQKAPNLMFCLISPAGIVLVWFLGVKVNKLITTVFVELTYVFKHY